MAILRNSMNRVRNRRQEGQASDAVADAVRRQQQRNSARLNGQPNPHPTLLDRAREQESLQPVSNSVQTFTPEHDAGLVDALVAYDSRPEDDRMDSQAQNSLIHVSSLPDLCPRAIALAAEHGNLSTLLKRVSSNDRIVWDMGRATESLVRDRIIESMGVEKVLGRWVCPCEAEEHYYEPEDNYTLPAGHHYVPCGCGRKQISQYQEVQLHDPEFGIIGNCDLPYFDDLGRVVVTEIKSAKGEYFRDLNTDDPWTQPNQMLRKMFTSHSFQASAYNRLFEKQGYPVAPYVRILYVSKNYLREVPYKEIIVPMDRMQTRLDNEWEKARIIKEALDTGTLPSRLSVCCDLDATRAKNCSLVTSCFSRG